MTKEEAIREVYGIPVSKKQHEALQTLIPELKESEDERIRKEILAFIRREGQHIDKYKWPKWIEYLEKQKINTEGDFGRGYDCGYQAGYDVAVNEMKPKVATAVLDSEKQKPAEDWKEKRKKECPFRRNLDNNLYGCERYAGVVGACDGNCSWVVDYPKLKEIQDKREQKPEVKLTGWVARDSEYNPYSGLGLILFNEKPRKYYDCWRGAIASQLPWENFPDLKWEDEPIKVEVTIKRK